MNHYDNAERLLASSWDSLLDRTASLYATRAIAHATLALIDQIRETTKPVKATIPTLPNDFAKAIADGAERPIEEAELIMTQKNTPLAPRRVGDPDDTGDDGEPCEAIDGDEGPACTLTLGHIGDHAAGDGERILAVWPTDAADAQRHECDTCGIDLTQDVKQTGKAEPEATDDLTITTFEQARDWEPIDGTVLADADGGVAIRGYHFWIFSSGEEMTSQDLITHCSPLRIIHIPGRDLAAERAVQELRKVAESLDKLENQLHQTDTPAYLAGMESAHRIVQDAADEIEREARS